MKTIESHQERVARLATQANKIGRTKLYTMGSVPAAIYGSEVTGIDEQEDQFLRR